MPTTLRARLLLAETAVNACHAAMLGKVHPKSPAWGLVYAVQDAKRSVTDMPDDKAALKIALKQIAESKPLAGAQGQYRAGMEHAFRVCARIANEAVASEPTLRKPMDLGNKSHLGDGVYVDFDGSGSIVMTTEDGIEVSNTIYLEPEVLRALDEYRKRLNPPPP